MDPAASFILQNYEDPDAIDETQQMSPPADCYPEGYYGEKAHEVDESVASCDEDSDNEEFRSTSVIIGDTTIGHILPDSDVLSTQSSHTTMSSTYKRARSSSESSSDSSDDSSDGRTTLEIFECLNGW